MCLEIPGGCIGYDKIALMRLPVCFAGFLGFLRFQAVAGGLGLGVGKYLSLQLLFPLQLRFQCFQFAAGLAHFLIGGIKSSFQLLRGSEAVLLVHIQRLGHLLDVVYLRPMLVAFALALAFFCSMSTSRCTPSCFGAVCGAFVGCMPVFPCRGYSGMAVAFSVALAAFRSKTARTAARSKSSPSLRAVMGFVLSGVR